MNHLLEVRGVHKRFGGVAALSGLPFRGLHRDYYIPQEMGIGFCPIRARLKDEGFILHGKGQNIRGPINPPIVPV